MKLNKIFMALAAMAVVGCSSDDLNVLAPEQQAAEDSRLVELDPNFVIAGVGVEDAGTRTHWEWNDPVAKDVLVNKFLPIWAIDPADGHFLYNVDPDHGIDDQYADLEAQAVGLCWLGQNPGTDTDVYTNYQFYHFGWLNIGETEAKVECNELKNGALYNEITFDTPATVAGDEADTDEFSLPSPKCDDGLNYNSGVYKTDNKSIFGGDYIVYYPFDPTFENAGTIPAKAQIKFDDVPDNSTTGLGLADPRLGDATFRYSSKVNIEGGAQASDFGLYNLSSLVQLRVALPADKTSTTEIDQIVLVSKSGKLLKQANLAADKILAGKKGTELYSEKEGEIVGTKTIVANFKNAVQLKATNASPISAFITVLPTTVDDLVVLVHSKAGKWASVDKANTEFKAGEAKRLDITVTDAAFTSDFIAVDEASLTKALTDARATISDLTKDKATIEVIGDITLESATYSITDAKDANITIKGDAIIVPEDVTLNVKTNMVSDVLVLGKSCCDGANGGRLDIQGGTLNNVTMVPTGVKNPGANYDAYNPWVTYSGAATIAAGKTFDVQAGNVEVKEAVKHKGNINIAEGAKLFVLGNETGDNGDLNFMGSTVVNDGTIEVTKGGKYDMTDANGNATASDGKRMTNNGTFIHNVDAGVGTAVQSMKQNGEYRCRVDAQKKLDDAFLQWKACSVIEMVNAGTTYNLGNACKHNGKFIDIEVNTTGGSMFNNPTPDDKEINIGNLSVLKGGLGVDYVNTVGTTTGKRTLTVNGDMTVKNGIGTTFTDSKKINIKQNLTLDGAWIYFIGAKKNEGGLAVTGDITVSGGAGNFDAGDVNALNITCANFTLAKGATASFGNRTEGDAMNMTVTGTIDNGAGCTFDIIGADQDGAGSVLAWVTCTKLEVGGTFSAARPRVVAAE
jgi:hypothetical protein